MSFAVRGPLYCILEDLSGGLVSDRVQVQSWTEGEGGVWTGSAVIFLRVDQAAAGFCIVDAEGWKVAPSVRFNEGPALLRLGDDLTVWPAIEFVKEYA